MRDLPAAQHLVKSTSAKITSCTVLNATSPTKNLCILSSFFPVLLFALFSATSLIILTQKSGVLGLLSSARATTMFSQYSLLAHVD